tara:strand:+ start:476 stop:625 length:150 start_codon:yes stop_codon:yes gene_type:complete
MPRFKSNRLLTNKLKDLEKRLRELPTSKPLSWKRSNPKKEKNFKRKQDF